MYELFSGKVYSIQPGKMDSNFFSLKIHRSIVSSNIFSMEKKIMG